MGLAMGEERLGEIWLHVARGQLADARAVLADAAASARASGHATSEMLLLTDVARLGGAAEIGQRMSELGEMCESELSRVRLQLLTSLISGDPAELLTVAEDFAQIGAHPFAAEAAATAAGFWRRDADNRRAVAANNHAQGYLSRCPRVGTPALMTLETAMLKQRERQIALLASQGSSSRDIAATLTLSVRTVDNHLQSAYANSG
jgi:Bacterial regulatory proteins, luxR family